MVQVDPETELYQYLNNNKIWTHWSLRRLSGSFCSFVAWLFILPSSTTLSSISMCFNMVIIDRVAQAVLNYVADAVDMDEKVFLEMHGRWSKIIKCTLPRYTYIHKITKLTLDALCTWTGLWHWHSLWTFSRSSGWFLQSLQECSSMSSSSKTTCMNLRSHTLLKLQCDFMDYFWKKKVTVIVSFHRLSMSWKINSMHTQYVSWVSSSQCAISHLMSTQELCVCRKLFILKQVMAT